ncbi:MAG: toll/interleukin-1 receptor domain-containing protein [Bacteroidales bacterium]|nr:toll/interleukin-1 receptor domain-containing protein [Bacteroidales bacterium]
MAIYDVFISYRRVDSTDRANLIRLYLSEWFDNDRVFLDIHEIHEGPFPSYIEDALSTSKYFIVLISKSSFVEKNESKKMDYYLEEIRMAINNNLKIIPILYDGIDINRICLPAELSSLKLKNAIVAHTDDPQSLKTKLHTFTKKKETGIKEWLAFPLAVISIYLIVGFLSGLGMYIYDNYLSSYDKAVEIAAEHVFEREGIFYYPISDKELVCYNSKTEYVNVIMNCSEGSNAIIIKDSDLYKVGFWSTATTLVYHVVKSKYKPHNGKQYFAYIGAIVAVVAGTGLGCTIEQMIFPSYRNKIISTEILKSSFWEDVISRRYSHTEQYLY